MVQLYNPIDMAGAAGEESASSHVFNLSSGARVRTKRVNLFTMRDFSRRFRAPEVPIIHDESTGRKIPNPNDPAYERAVEEYEIAVNEAGENVLLIKGVDILHQPDSLPRLEDDEWIDEQEFLLGIKIPTTGPARKVAWMRYVLLNTPDEIKAILEDIMALSGTREEAVIAAMETFPSDEGRGEHHSGAPEASNQNGGGLAAPGDGADTPD